jgi:hypothetical protein
VGLLSTLTWGKPGRLVAEAIGAERGTILVIGAPRLARVLADRGLDVRTATARAPADTALAALVTRSPEAATPALWAGVAPGGAVVLLGAAPAAEQSRRALCAGLVDLEQRRAGRLVVTSGRTPRG